MDVSEFLECNGKDEMYTEFYFCPRCNENDILNYHKFCPCCGLDLFKWHSEREAERSK